MIYLNKYLELKKEVALSHKNDEDKFNLLKDILLFTLNHPERERLFNVGVVRELSQCNINNPDKSPEITLMNTTFSFGGVLGDLVESGFSLFYVEDEKDLTFDFTIVTEGGDLIEEDKYLNSKMSYNEFVNSLFKHFNAYRLDDVKEDFLKATV